MCRKPDPAPVGDDPARTAAYLRGLRNGLAEAADICAAVADRFGTEDGFAAACCCNEITARVQETTAKLCCATTSGHPHVRDAGR